MLKVERVINQPGPNFIYDDFLKSDDCPLNIWVDEEKITNLYQKVYLPNKKITEETVYLGWEAWGNTERLLGEYDIDDKIAGVFLESHYKTFENGLVSMYFVTKEGNDLRHNILKGYSGDLSRLDKYLVKNTDVWPTERAEKFLESLLWKVFQREVNGTLAHEIHHSTDIYLPHFSTGLNRRIAEEGGARYFERALMRSPEWRSMVKVGPKRGLKNP